MLIDIPETIAASAATALRLYALELQHTCSDWRDKLSSGIASVADEEMERLRVGNLEKEAECLLLVEKLIRLNLSEQV